MADSASITELYVYEISMFRVLFDRCDRRVRMDASVVASDGSYGGISRRSERQTRVEGFQYPSPGAIARHKPNVRLLPGYLSAMPQPFSTG
jgi:hypothetical protein